MNIYKKIFLGFFIAGTAVLFLSISGCSGSNNIQGKQGAQLWGENCVRCHNAPSPAAFNDFEWETVGKHMYIRASLTDEEVKKIVAFMKMAN